MSKDRAPSPSEHARVSYYGADTVSAATAKPALVFSYASHEQIAQVRREALQLKLKARMEASRGPTPVDPYVGLETDAQASDNAQDVHSVARDTADEGRMRHGGVEQYEMLVVPPKLGMSGDEQLTTAKVVCKGQATDYQRSYKPVTGGPMTVPVGYDLKDEEDVSTQRRSRSPGRTGAQAAAASISRPTKTTTPPDPMLQSLRQSIAVPYVSVPVNPSMVPIKGMGSTAQVIQAVRGAVQGVLVKPLLTTAAMRTVVSGSGTQDGVVQSYAGGNDLTIKRGSDNGYTGAGSKTTVPLVLVKEEDLMALHRKQSAQKLLARAGLSRAPSFRHSKSRNASTKQLGSGNVQETVQITPLSKKMAAAAASEAAKHQVESTSKVAFASLMSAMAPPAEASRGIPGFDDAADEAKDHSVEGSEGKPMDADAGEIARVSQTGEGHKPAAGGSVSRSPSLQRSPSLHQSPSLQRSSSSTNQQASQQGVPAIETVPEHATSTHESLSQPGAPSDQPRQASQPAPAAVPAAQLQATASSHHSRPPQAPTSRSSAPSGLDHAPPQWMTAHLYAATSQRSSTSLYPWQDHGPRHRPHRPMSAYTMSQSVPPPGQSFMLTSRDTAPSRPASAAGPGGFTFQVTGLGYTRAMASRRDDVELFRPVSVTPASRDKSQSVSGVVPTRKTTSRDRNGVLAWRASDGASSSLVPAVEHTSTSPQGSTAVLSSPRQMVSRPASANPLQHSTPTMAELAAQELAAAQADLQYRVLQLQASAHGVNTPADLLQGHKYPACDVVTAVPSAVKHLQIKSSSPCPRPAIASAPCTPRQVQATTGQLAPAAQGAVSSWGAAAGSKGPGSSGGGAGPAFTSSLQAQHAMRPGSARPHASLPLTASGVAIKRTRPPSAGAWAGTPHLAAVISEFNKAGHDECELLWSASSNPYDTMPGVGVAPVGGFLLPVTVATAVAL